MNILLAIDGSPQSLIARDLVAGLKWPGATTVHLVAAYQVPMDWTGGVGSSMDWIGNAEDEMRDKATAQLRDVGTPLTECGLRVAYHVERGRPAEVILTAAAELRADLVVTGSRGRGALRSTILGSVAGEVGMHAPCPHLVARTGRVSRVLVATDGSDAAAQIPARLHALGAFREKPTDVLSVVVPDPPSMDLMVGLYTLGDQRLSAMHRELHEHAVGAAAKTVDAFRKLGVTATPHLRTGDAAAEIVAAAEKLGADLIVTGSRGLGGLERLLLGSVARNVILHSHTSVLVIPDQVVVEARESQRALAQQALVPRVTASAAG